VGWSKLYQYEDVTICLWQGYAMMLLVDTLLYNLIGCGLNLRLGGVSLFFYWLIPSSHTMALLLFWPLNRNEYQGHILGGYSARCIGLTSLPPSCADCLQIMAASPSWIPKCLSWPVMGQLDLVAWCSRAVNYRLCCTEKCWFVARWELLCRRNHYKATAPS